MNNAAAQARFTELSQEYHQQGLSLADAAAAATTALGEEGAPSSAVSNQIQEANSDGGGEEMPDAKRHKTGGAGGEHTADLGLSSNAGGSAVGLPSGTGGAAGGGERKEGTVGGGGGGFSEGSKGSKGGTGGAGGESKEGGAHQAPGGCVNNLDGSLNIFHSASLSVNAALRTIGLGTLTASVGGSIHSVFGGNGVAEKLVLAFLVPTQANPADPLCVGVEGLRAACHGGWVLVERQLESMFLPALLCVLEKAGGGGGGKGGSSGGSGKGGKGGKDGGTQAHMYGEKGVPATVAAALAVHRNVSCFAGVRAFAASVGKRGDVMEGVVRGETGLVVEINWGSKNLRGTLPVGDLNMPGLRVLDLRRNYSLKGEREGERERVLT